jgi:hypothetical protein
VFYGMRLRSKAGDSLSLMLPPPLRDAPIIVVDNLLNTLSPAGEDGGIFVAM